MVSVRFEKVFVAVGLLFFSCVSVNAQNKFTGKVVNQLGKVVAGSTISILNSSEKTISDSTGFFSFDGLKNGKYSFNIKSIGYANYITTIVVPSNVKVAAFTLNEEVIQLDDVKVTAQKKEEVLQQIPMSISSFSSTQIEKLNLWNNKDLSGLVPNLYSANSGDNRDVTSIRGIATTSYDPTVATYIDGVNQFSLDTYIPVLFDVERIEILRGPQGSLYGRNAMGGVINIITKQPSNEFNGFAEISTGNYNQQRYTFGIKSPIVKNKLFGGASFLYHQRDGFYTNTFNASSYDKQNSFAGNYFLKYLISSKWQVNFNLKNYNGTNDGAYPLVVGASKAISNPFKLNQNGITQMKDQTLNTSLDLKYTGNNFNFNSISSYQNNYRYYTLPIDGDFSPIDAITVINNYGSEWNNIKVTTQEFKFTSPSSSNSKLKWTAGTYLFNQDAPVKQGTRFGKDAKMLGIGDALFSVVNTSLYNKKGIAFYGQATYALSEKLNLTLGIRNDYEKQSQTVAGFYQHDPNVKLFQTVKDTTGSINFNALSPKLTLDYKLNMTTLVYGNFSRGFRTGGLSPLSSDPSQPPLIGYKPEYSNNFEIGMKNSWFKNKLVVNLVAFYTKVNDAQVPSLQLPDAVTVTKNTGILNSKGLELELGSTPIKGLLIQFNAGMTDATYEKLDIAEQGGSVNLKGKKSIFTPNTTTNLILQYTYYGANKNISAFIRSESKNTGTTYFDLNNDIKQSPYFLQNASMGLNHKKVSITVWAKNLFDQKYIAYAYDFGAVHLGNPSTFGITLSTKF